MEETMSIILDIVQAAGGVMLYSDMMKHVPPQYVRNVPMALRRLKQEGTVEKQNRVVNGVVRFEVFQPGMRK
jgi:hypothetical protein